MLLTLHSQINTTVPMLGYLSYQQSDFVLVLTRYNFSATAGLYAFSPPRVTFLNLGLESLFSFSPQMMSFF